MSLWYPITRASLFRGLEVPYLILWGSFGRPFLEGGLIWGEAGAPEKGMPGVSLWIFGIPCSRTLFLWAI